MAFNRRDLTVLRTLNLLPGARVLTLGRQEDRVKSSGFAERHFRDAAVVDSIDRHLGEGATFAGDLNLPILNLGVYDLVWDGGTIEHCFNVPEALQNVKRFLGIGGIFLSSQLAGITGHGFYTLSPEVLWRWSALNGFTNQRLMAYSPLLGWTEDLRIGAQRLEFRSFWHTYFWFYCRKRDHVEENRFPQQSMSSLPRPKWI